MRTIAITVPLPAEVRPMTKPVVAPVTIAAMMWRRYRCIAERSGITSRSSVPRTSVAIPTTISAAPSIPSTRRFTSSSP